MVETVHRHWSGSFPSVRRGLQPSRPVGHSGRPCRCLLYTSDAADERSSVDLGGRRIIKKKKSREIVVRDAITTQH